MRRLTHFRRDSSAARLATTAPRVATALVLTLVLGLGPGSGIGPARASAAPAAPSITATWTGLPLHAVCSRLSALLGRPVILDRRVDPDLPVTLELRAAGPRDSIERVCRTTGTECVALAESIRILPARRSARVLAAAEVRGAALAGLPAASRGTMEKRTPWSWGEGATPRELVGAAARDAGLVLEGVDALPHDHLRGADLPALSLAERLDLILSQYDRTIDWGGARSSGGQTRAEIVRLEGPDRDGPPVVATVGAWESLAAVRRAPAGEGETTWSLEVAAPLDRLLATVADRLGLRLEIDREGMRRRGIAASGVVRLAVKEVSAEELLDRIVEPLGLSWSIDGDRLRVGPGAE